MTRGPWKYQKSKGHHHVLIGDEVLDVDLEENARAIALVPDMVKFIRHFNRMELKKAFATSAKLLKKLRKLSYIKK